MAHGQESKKEDAAHDELRALKEKIHKAYDAGNIDELVSYFTDDAVVTWQNGETKKGPKEIKAYMEAMGKGPNAPVKSATINPHPTDLTHLYGDSGVAYGTSKDEFLLRDGTKFGQDSHWTATVVKQNGQWKVAGLHVCVNMFDNEILDKAAKKVALYSGGAGLLAGLLLGAIGAALIGWMRRAK